MDYGPLQPMPGDKVRIGVIGTAKTSDRFAQFIERCSTGVDGKSQKLVACGWLVQLNRRCSRGPFHRRLAIPIALESAARSSIRPPSGHIFMLHLSRAPRAGASNGGSNMALRKARYIAEHDEPAEMELEGEIREFVSRDVVSNVGRRPENESELVASNINSVLQRVTATSVQEIDALISELESSRDMLHSEAARVQREIVQYSTLIQGALHSTKIIAESLTQWKKVPDAQTLSD